MKQLKVAVVAGARPNFMKIQPFLAAVEARNGLGRPGEPGIVPYLVHTGQHYDNDMSGIFFRELGIKPPDINLEVGSASHAEQTARIMLAFEKVCLDERPDWVVVVGDVNSTMACTLVCSKLGIRVAHIEAGLRSGDRTMPEEINRLVTDVLADLLFTPSEDADRNLLREGVPQEKVRRVGNIMIDSLVANLPRARESRIMSGLGIEPGRFAYVTLHRPGNVDERGSLENILSCLARLAETLPVVFPIHPRTKKMAAGFGLTPPNGSGLKFTGPVGYHDSLCLAENARLVLTDSGGLQEETTFFRTPCLTLRPNTERPVTISMGSNRLTRIDTLFGDIERTLAGPEKFGGVPPLWDGRTAERIVEQLVSA